MDRDLLGFFCEKCIAEDLTDVVFEREVLKMTQRLLSVWGWGGVTDSEAEGVGGFLKDSGLIIMSDLSECTLSKLAFIHDLISMKWMEGEARRGWIEEDQGPSPEGHLGKEEQ